MHPLLARVVQNPAVRKTALALVLAVLAALGYGASAGCARLATVRERAESVLECQIGVLETVVPRYVAEDLAMAARAGSGEYVVAQLLALGVSPEEINQAAAAFLACTQSAPPSPEPADAGPVLTPA